MNRECFKCHQVLPFTAFFKDNGPWMKDKRKGLTQWCKKCIREQRLKRGREHENAVSRARDARHREAMSDQYWKKIAKFHHLPYERVKNLWDEQKGKCYYCHIALNGNNLNIEHYYPRDPIKIVLSCVDCNTLKWDKDGDEFIVFLKEYVSRFNEAVSPARKSE